MYGNNLAQQITSTFDVTVCLLSLAVLAVMLFTGPLAGYWVRRRETRTPAPASPVADSAVSAPSAPPTLARPAQPAAVPKIVRLREDSTTMLAAPPTEGMPAPTTALRIIRREPASEPTAQWHAPSDDEPPTTSGPIGDR
ncbi:hypothetical protein A5662_26415 [Mycobacteriaceae bacterium 1482268.1]|nr:hypothetical protein A5662_26415 [Mycobacteriaceae bacterium 1482268.1]